MRKGRSNLKKKLKKKLKSHESFELFQKEGSRRKKGKEVGVKKKVTQLPLIE